MNRDHIISTHVRIHDTPSTTSFNSLVPGKCGCNNKLLIFRTLSVPDILSFPCEILPSDLTDDYSTFVQVMAWCRQDARLLGTMAIFMPHYFLKIHQLKWAGNLKVSRGCMRSYEVRWYAKMEPLHWTWTRIGLNLVSEELNSPPSCSVMAVRHLV